MRSLLRAWAAVLAFLCVPGLGRAEDAGIDFVQVAGGNGPGSPYVLSFPTTPGAGHLLVVALNFAPTTGTVSVSDGCGGPFTSAVGPTSILQGSHAQQTFYAAAFGCDAGALTYNTSGVVYLETIQLEYAGADPAAPVDVALEADGGTGSLTVGPVVTREPGDLLFAWIIASNTVTDGGAGEAVRSRYHADLVEDAPCGVPGPYAATAVSDSEWAAQLLALRPFAPPAAGPRSLLVGCSAGTGLGPLPWLLLAAVRRRRARRVQPGRVLR